MSAPTGTPLTAAAVIAAQARRVPGTEDQLAIGGLIVRYARCVDLGLVDDAVALFTLGGVWDGSGIGRPRVEGRDDIRRHFEAAIDPDRLSLHVMHPPLLAGTVDTDHALGVVTFSHLRGSAGGGMEASVQTFGEYVDEYHRQDGTWRIASRSMAVRMIIRGGPWKTS